MNSRFIRWKAYLIYFLNTFLQYLLTNYVNHTVSYM